MEVEVIEAGVLIYQLNALRIALTLFKEIREGQQEDPAMDHIRDKLQEGNA